MPRKTKLVIVSLVLLVIFFAATTVLAMSGKLPGVNNKHLGFSPVTQQCYNVEHTALVRNVEKVEAKKVCVFFATGVEEVR